MGAVDRAKHGIHRVCGKPLLASPNKAPTHRRNGLALCAEIEPIMQASDQTRFPHYLDAAQGLPAPLQTPKPQSVGANAACARA
jgi:hypothetical protein